jgi:hypothetical protein
MDIWRVVVVFIALIWMPLPETGIEWFSLLAIVLATVLL